MEGYLTPHPSALIESMRSIGYRPSTALADLVDNCITAKAAHVEIELQPNDGNQSGWLRIEDDGQGMTHDELVQAMRWGGDGPLAARDAKDLGRFGLGLKTASFSLGRRLTVISRKCGQISMLRWDLDHIYNSGEWDLQEGVDSGDAEFLKCTKLLDSTGTFSGTIVLVSQIDKLSVEGHSDAQRHSNKTKLIRDIQNHLGLVFHRFLEKKKLHLKYGGTSVYGWNLFSLSQGGEQLEWLKSTEMLSSGKVNVKTFILPHYKSLTDEEHNRLGGPLGWGAHQGFIIYREDRLIISGGWLGLFKPEEHCNLVRIAVDLPNNLDSAWDLNVIKSKVSPPAIIKGDLERIAAAGRKGAMEANRFHGSKVAPFTENDEDPVAQHAFWKQLAGPKEVRFKINRSHPLVEALVQAVSDKPFADAFLKAFEQLLPIAAILQQPSKSTNGLIIQPTEIELFQLRDALRLAIDVYLKIGHDESEATALALSCQPFSNHQDNLRRILKSNRQSQ